MRRTRNKSRSAFWKNRLFAAFVRESLDLSSARPVAVPNEERLVAEEAGHARGGTAETKTEVIIPMFANISKCLRLAEKGVWIVSHLSIYLRGLAVLVACAVLISEAPAQSP